VASLIVDVSRRDLAWVGVAVVLFFVVRAALSRASLSPGGERAVILLIAGLGLAWTPHRGWVANDAFISFRYARNWVEGHGLVFNAGERVEGYTNFLWILLLSPFQAAGASLPPVSVVLTTGCNSGIAARGCGSRSGFAGSWRSPYRGPPARGLGPHRRGRAGAMASSSTSGAWRRGGSGFLAGRPLSAPSNRSRSPRCSRLLRLRTRT
jgi:hypothetical protein